MSICAPTRHENLPLRLAVATCSDGGFETRGSRETEDVRSRNARSWTINGATLAGGAVDDLAVEVLSAYLNPSRMCASSVRRSACSTLTKNFDERSTRSDPWTGTAVERSA